MGRAPRGGGRPDVTRSWSRHGEPDARQRARPVRRAERGNGQSRKARTAPRSDPTPSEHLWTLAKALCGEGTPAAAQWAEHATHLLWRHGPAPLLALLRETAAPTPAAAKALATERGSFATNAARMQYPTFRRQGLPIGSGAVESAAKRLVQLRLKRPGMRWSDLGARAILHLRCHSLGGHATDDLPLAA